MNQIKAIKFFVENLHYWSRRFHIPLEIKSRRGMWAMANVNRRKDDSVYCTYNPKYFNGGYTKSELLAIIFHELGHLKKNALYKIVGKIKAEYISETFALNCLKKYYPKNYKYILKYLPKRLKYYKTFKKSKQYYYEAFKQIKEYQSG